MDLQRENSASLQQQIVALLREEIERGSYEPTGRLPSEAALCARFGVSRVTVRLALAKLSGEGSVERKQGKGTYAAGKRVRHGLDQLRSFHESLLMQGFDASMRLLARAVVAAPERVRALALEGAQDGRCLLLERLHLVDGAPIALGRNYLPPALDVLASERIAQQPAYAILAELTGMPVVRAEITIEVGLAEADVAAALGVAAGSALLVMERASYFTDDRCCDCSVFYIRPERYAFVVKTAFAPGR